jgi:putative oxidoreductase
MHPSDTAVDFGLLVLRLSLGGVFLAHGINHIWGGGRIPGTARWFESLGMKPGLWHAWTASISEVAGGALAVIGLLTPLAAAAVVGTMTVAWVTNHLHNGFFIFRPGEGWEYVATLLLMGIVLSALGPGEWSVDAHVGQLSKLSGWWGLVIAVAAGAGGAGALLAVFWRPIRPAK